MQIWLRKIENNIQRYKSLKMQDRKKKEGMRNSLNILIFIKNNLISMFS